MKFVSVATLAVISALVSPVHAATLTGSNGSITGVTTTAPLHQPNMGSLNPNALIDGNITGNANTFVEYLFSPSETETFSFTLSQAFDVNQFLLWNDRGVADSGLKDFTLNFFDSSNALVGSYSDAAELPFRGNNPVPEVFSFSTMTNVTQIDLVITSPLTVSASTPNIQFREVEFDGVASVPEPLSILGTVIAAGIGVAIKRKY